MRRRINFNQVDLKKTRCSRLENKTCRLTSPTYKTITRLFVHNFWLLHSKGNGNAARGCFNDFSNFFVFFFHFFLFINFFFNYFLVCSTASCAISPKMALPWPQRNGRENGE